ncbi:hypothetical protein LSH36_85g05020, partial [Paralvinella palmiformis]
LKQCYVVSCSKGDYQIKLWKCTTHLVHQGDLPWDCPQPFIVPISGCSEGS